MPPKATVKAEMIACELCEGSGMAGVFDTCGACKGQGAVAETLDERVMFRCES